MLTEHFWDLHHQQFTGRQSPWRVTSLISTLHSDQTVFHDESISTSPNSNQRRKMIKDIFASRYIKSWPCREQIERKRQKLVSCFDFLLKKLANDYIPSVLSPDSLKLQLPYSWIWLTTNICIICVYMCNEIFWQDFFHELFMLKNVFWFCVSNLSVADA